MIVEFRFRNFRSFRDLQTLSFVATADTSLPDNVTAEPQIGDKRLVRAAVIYGANASGKSGIIEALDCLRELVRSSGSRKPGEPIPVQPFGLDDISEGKPSEFELTFIYDDVRYIYTLAADVRRIHQEVLVAYPNGLPQTWFERKYDAATKETHYRFGSSLRGEKKRLQALTRESVPFLTVAATFNHAQLGKVYDYFDTQIYVLTSELVANTEILEGITARFSSIEALNSRITAALRNADLGIHDYRIEGRDDERTSTPNALRDLPGTELTAEQREEIARWFSLDVRLLHKSSKASGELVEFPISRESRGTRRLFSLSGYWFMALLNGAVIAVDELDASLHPLLVRAQLKTFFSETYNQHEAQLLFNTHDTTLLDTTILRRDQIWFVEKDQEGASHLYPLSDFSPRKDGALERGYLRGRYGAIPFIDFAAGKGLLDAEAARQ